MPSLQNQPRSLEEIEQQTDADSIAFRKEVLAAVPMLAESEQLQRWRSDNKVVAVSDGDRLVYPGFQFDAEGQPLPIVSDLLRLLRADTELCDWDHVAWFVSDTGWLDGHMPAERMRTDPEAVRFAAQQYVLQLRDEH